MSVNYKVKAIGKPGVKAGKPNYYATIQRNGKIGYREVAELVGELYVAHPAVVIGVMEGLETVIANCLMDGVSVQFGNIGTFHPSIKSEPVQEAKDLKANHIKCLNVNFRQSSQFKNRLTEVRFKKVKNDSSNSQA